MPFARTKTFEVPSRGRRDGFDPLSNIITAFTNGVVDDFLKLFLAVDHHERSREVF